MATSPIENSSVRNLFAISLKIKFRIRIKHNTRVARLRETLFKALKSQGFDFAATHLTELDRIEKLLALLAIAFFWAHLFGEWLHEQKPIPIKSHHRPAISIFRYGLDWLREILFNITEKLETFYLAVALFEEPRRSN